MSQWITLQHQQNISHGRYVVPNFASNSICIKGLNGQICVISPGESLLESFSSQYPEADLDSGQNLMLVAPNAYHFMGLEAWCARYPNAKVYSSAKARPQLARKGVPDIHLLDEGGSSLLEGSAWVCPPGHRGGDIWFVFPEGDNWGWVTCDSFLNYPRVSNQPVARAMQRLMGAAPGLKLSRVIKYFILTDRERFKQWMLEVLVSHPPTTLLPSHGEPLQSEVLPEQIRALIRDRL